MSHLDWELRDTVMYIPVSRLKWHILWHDHWPLERVTAWLLAYHTPSHHTVVEWLSAPVTAHGNGGG